MRVRNYGVCLAAAWALAAGAQALQPVVVANVKYEPAMQLAGTALRLNGAGIRYKTVFQVYTAGLYLEKKASNQQEVVTLQGPKRMSITMLREIDSAELGKLFMRSMEDNMEKAAYTKIITSVLRMSQVFSDHKRLLPGEQFQIDWIPSIGTIITVKGKTQGEPFKEPEFFNALMSIWLGHTPADWKLKDALLDQK